MRVISLVPSATEMLCLVGGRDLLVGRSHECDWPPGVESVPVLTSQRTPGGAGVTALQIDQAVRGQVSSGSSLYSLDEGLALALKPDVILTQDLCSVCSIDADSVRRMAERVSPRPRVVSLNPASVEGVLDDLLTVGREVGQEATAREAVVRLRERMYRAIEHVNPYADGPSVAVLEWTDPLFIAGHWTPQLVERAGARHPLNPTRVPEVVGSALPIAGPSQQASRTGGPSIQITAQALVESKPERLIVCPCGVPLRGSGSMTVESLVTALAQQPWWSQLPAVRAGRVALVDGNQMFSRPGPRLVDALEWLVGWLHDRPDLIPSGFPWRELSTGHPQS